MTAHEPSQESIFTESSRIRVATGDLIPTASFSAAATFLDHVIAEGEGLYLLTGATGSGKTALLNYCRDRATDHAAVLLAPLRRIDADNLSALLNEAFGVDHTAKQGPRAQDLRYFLKLGTLRAKGKRFVLALDEVEEIHSSGAELIRALLEMKAQDTTLITIILSGNHQLGALLNRSYRWGIQKLIRGSHQIAALNVDQAGDLIDQIPALRGESAIGFKRGAKKALVSLSGGIAGPMIQLGHHAAAIAREYGAKSVSARMVRSAASGDYRSPASVVAGTTWKTVLGLLILLLVPATLVQQNLGTKDFSSQPIGGFTNNVKTPSTDLSATPATEQQPLNQAQPRPADTEDDIAAIPAAPITETGTAPDDTDPGSTQRVIAATTNVVLRPEFNLEIQPGSAVRYLHFATEIPSGIAIYRSRFRSFNERIPSTPTP